MIPFIRQPVLTARKPTAFTDADVLPKNSVHAAPRIVVDPLANLRNLVRNYLRSALVPASPDSLAPVVAADAAPIPPI